MLNGGYLRGNLFQIPQKDFSEEAFLRVAPFPSGRFKRLEIASLQPLPSSKGPNGRSLPQR